MDSAYLLHFHQLLFVALRLLGVAAVLVIGVGVLSGMTEHGAEAEVGGLEGVPSQILDRTNLTNENKEGGREVDVGCVGGYKDVHVNQLINK